MSRGQNMYIYIRNLEAEPESLKIISTIKLPSELERQSKRMSVTVRRPA